MKPNIPDAGRVPANEPEPVNVCGVEIMPDSSMKLLCGNCDHHIESGPMNYCPQCGAALLAPFRWTPPPSQEARAAAHGLTRTRAASDPKCALCQDDRVVNYPGEGRGACPACSNGKYKY